MFLILLWSSQRAHLSFQTAPGGEAPPEQRGAADFRRPENLHPKDQSLKRDKKPWKLTCQNRTQRSEPYRPPCHRELSPLAFLSTMWSSGSIKWTGEPNGGLCAEQESCLRVLTTLPARASFCWQHRGSVRGCADQANTCWIVTEGRK